MTTADEGPIDPTRIEALYHEHGVELRAFLTGLLKDRDLAAEVFQTTFRKAVEDGHQARAESFKSWVFRVAYNEAMLLRRKQSIHETALRKLSYTPIEAPMAADEMVIRAEEGERIRAAMAELPEEQRQVVERRIFEQRRFSDIAEELGAPLGTVLTRMRLAIQKLRTVLGVEDLR